MEVAALQAAGLADAQQPFDVAVAVVGAGSAAAFAQQHREAQRTLGAVVGGVDAGSLGEVPQRGPQVGLPVAMEQERTLSRSVADSQMSTLASRELVRQRERARAEHQDVLVL